MEQELEKAKSDLEKIMNSENISLEKVYEVSSEIDDLIIQKYNQILKQKKG